MRNKGSISSMLEIYFGVIVIMFIFISSIYFAGRSEVNSEADVIAINTGLECYNNLNNILKTDKIFGEKSSYYLGRSNNEIQDLNSIKNYIVNINSDYRISFSENCDDIKEGCSISEEDSKIIIGDIDRKSIVTSCSMGIAKSICEEDCIKFINMEVYN